MLAAMLGLAASCGERVDPVVAEAARVWRSVPTRSDFRIVSARGEGRTLILQVEIPSDVSQVLDARAIAQMFSVCPTPREANFFSEGRALRVELSRAGHATTSATVSRCSGPVGNGVNIDTFVQMLRPMVGRDLGEGARVTSVRAEGQTLVLVFDGPRGWREGLDQAAIAWGFLEQSCSQARGFALFDGTRSLRIDTTEGGSNLIPGQLIRRCPAPPIPRPQAPD